MHSHPGDQPHLGDVGYVRRERSRLLQSGLTRGGVEYQRHVSLHANVLHGYIRENIDGLVALWKWPRLPIGKLPYVYQGSEAGRRPRLGLL